MSTNLQDEIDNIDSKITYWETVLANDHIDADTKRRIEGVIDEFKKHKSALQYVQGSINNGN